MKADQLRLEELVRFSKGLMDLHGRRLVIQDLHALGQFRRDIVEMVGQAQRAAFSPAWVTSGDRPTRRR